MAVRVDAGGVLAHYAEWIGRRTGRAVAGLGPEDSTAVMYVADELLLDGERVKFFDVPRVDDQESLLSLAAPEFRGDVVVTSDIGAAVAALAARYRLEGRCAELDLVSSPEALPVRLEGNSSFDTAAQMLFQAAHWSPCLGRRWGPGTYDAAGSGYFRLKVPERTIYTRPAATISGPGLKVILYDDRRVEVERWTGVHDLTIHPPEWSACYLSVSCPTRYRIGTGMWLDTSIFPGLIGEIEELPKWWTDPPPIVLTAQISHFLYDLGRADGPALVLNTAPNAVHVELINRAGQVIREAHQTATGLVLDTAGLCAGHYVVQATRQAADPVSLQLLPPLDVGCRQKIQLTVMPRDEL